MQAKTRGADLLPAERVWVDWLGRWEPGDVDEEEDEEEDKDEEEDPGHWESHSCLTGLGEELNELLLASSG